jgi:hypothetical protein
MILPVPFTDHHAVILSINMGSKNVWRVRRDWRMNPTMLRDECLKMVLHDKWKEWQRAKPYYPNVALWWDRHIRRHLQFLSRQHEARQRKEIRLMDDHLYQHIYDIIKSEMPHATKRQTLNKDKAKILRLWSYRHKTILLDTAEHDALDDEELSLYQMVKIRHRNEERVILKIRDARGVVQDDPTEVCNVFRRYLLEKYAHIPVCVDSLLVLEQIISQPADHPYDAFLNLPINQEELRAAITKGGKHKAPGPDGISEEFFKLYYDTIKEDLLEVVNQMFLRRTIAQGQKQGTIACLPKQQHPDTPDDFRQITLLNVEYQLLARILATRLAPVLEDFASPFQYCGVPRNTIMDSVSTIRDVIAYAKTTNTPLCVISLDFRQAFDNISHIYIYTLNS